MIRNARLKRRLRGYDREETDEFLATVAESYDRMYAERQSLSDEVARLRRERQEGEKLSHAELDRLKDCLSERDRHVADLEAQFAHLEEERSKQADELNRLREELLNVRALQEELEAELHEQHDRTARFAIREKALVEQRAMLVSQLDEEATQTAGTEQRALPERSDRVAAMLLRLDRFVETLERESRREAELTLKKARERADEIVQTAETQSRQAEAEAPHAEAADEGGEEYDPVWPLARIGSAVTEPTVSDALEGDIGEASWTSRARSDETPGPSR
jgi:DivIVA domain-containing protein